MDSHKDHRDRDRESSQNSIVQQKDQLGYVINRYSKGRMLGKGGFAKCYEFVDLKTNVKYAAKIVQKATLTRSKAKQKLASQIKIHSTVKSEYVAKYQRFFEDSQYVYIMLELCCNQTLNELIKRRKRITQIQAKYYLHQLALGIKDIHEEGIIHRVLKLGNLFINEKLKIKIRSQNPVNYALFSNKEKNINNKKIIKKSERLSIFFTFLDIWLTFYYLQKLIIY